jgi:hypothetical protein
MSEIAELRRKAAQFARLSTTALDCQSRREFAELTVEFAREADRLEVEASRLKVTTVSCS